MLSTKLLSSPFFPPVVVSIFSSLSSLFFLPLLVVVVVAVAVAIAVAVVVAVVVGTDIDANKTSGEKKISSSNNRPQGF